MGRKEETQLSLIAEFDTEREKCNIFFEKAKYRNLPGWLLDIYCHDGKLMFNYMFL